MTKVRYKIHGSVGVLFLFSIKFDTPDCDKLDRKQVPVTNCTHVNILQRSGKDYAKLRLYYADGTINEGWTHLMDIDCPIVIDDPDGELMDGRFNV